MGLKTTCTIIVLLLSTTSYAFEKQGTLPEKWINGERCATEEKIQVHQYNKDFYILRQSLCTHFEAPFIYLIFGGNKVFMQDTGASDVALVEKVDEIINTWMENNNKTTLQLIVSHSHGHSDHVFADQAFSKRPFTQVIGKSQPSVASFFSFDDWPNTSRKLDLGGRIIEILPIPGHQDAHLAVYDETTQIVLTGDSLYPGRLYVKQGAFPQFKNSILRLTHWLSDKSVKFILGTHIEMTNQPGKDYGFEAVPHLNERTLQLTKSDLLELNRSVQSLTPPIQKTVFDNFILFPLD